MHPLDLTPVGCCLCGCGERTSSRQSSWASKGWTKGEPRSFVRGHGSQPLPIELDPHTGCWEWYGKRDKAGYGRLRRGQRDWLAHRWVYARLVRELGSHELLDHLCRNPRCVSPEHLEPATDAVNVRRGIGTKLTEIEVAHIRAEAGRIGLGQHRQLARDLAPDLGVAESTIRNAIGGFTWSEPQLRRERA